MPTPPFVDAGTAEVISRVAYRLIEMNYRKTRATHPSLIKVINSTIAPLPKGPFSDLVLALVGCELACIEGKMRAVQWRDRAVYASRLGMSFRHCYYVGYKATRRR